jgi:hypothetical protein
MSFASIEFFFLFSFLDKLRWIGEERDVGGNGDMKG